MLHSGQLVLPPQAAGHLEQVELAQHDLHTACKACHAIGGAQSSHNMVRECISTANPATCTCCALLMQMHGCRNRSWGDMAHLRHHNADLETDHEVRHGTLAGPHVGDKTLEVRKGADVHVRVRYHVNSCTFCRVENRKGDTGHGNMFKIASHKGVSCA